MIRNILEQINSLVSALKIIYSKQGRTGKILFPGLFLLVFCCLCLVPIRLLSLESGNSPAITPSPIFLPSQAGQATPTALFNFGATPFPTLVAPSALPTTPGPATATQTPTPFIPTATETFTPTSTSTNPPPTASSSGSVLIIAVNKPEEYADIQNVGNGPVDLNGWKLVSETGNQSCTLSGILQPNEVLRVWARTGSPGFSCNYPINIWNDNQADPAALYDPQGKEISRYP